MFIDILVGGGLVGTNAIKNDVFCYNICANNSMFLANFHKICTIIY